MYMEKKFAEFCFLSKMNFDLTYKSEFYNGTFNFVFFE